MSTTADTPKPSDKTADAPQPVESALLSANFCRGWLWSWSWVCRIYGLKFRPTPVTAHAVATGEVRGEVMGTGTLEARVKTTISPRIQERLAEVLVDQGDSVKVRPIARPPRRRGTKQQVAIAEATLAAARATVERVRADEARAQAVLKQAQLDHKRLDRIARHQGRSPSGLRQGRRSPARRRSRSQALAGRHRGGREPGVHGGEESALPQGATGLHRNSQSLRRTGHAPRPRPRRDRRAGSSILQLVATNEIWVSAWVDETAMTGLKAGQPARVVFRSEPAKS